MSFATLSQIDFKPTSTPGSIQIAYEPTSEGKVEFVRKTPHQVETVRVFAVLGSGKDDPANHFVWTGQEVQDFTITARYRKGLFVVEKNFAPPGVSKP